MYGDSWGRRFIAERASIVRLHGVVAARDGNLGVARSLVGHARRGGFHGLGVWHARRYACPVHVGATRDR